MKKALKFLLIVVLLAGFYAVSNLSIFAQSTAENCPTIYQFVVDNRNNPEVEKLRRALSSGNDYLNKCKDADDAEKTYVTGQIPKIQERIRLAEIKILENRYVTAGKTKKYDDMVAAGKELLKMDRPYSLDLMLDFASMGLDNASAKPAVNKYNDDALAYAKQALQGMAEGKTSGNVDKTTGKADMYGIYVPYKNAKCKDGKTNATGWMNFTIGYITYVGMKQPEDALPYLYKANQVGCDTKEYAELYRLIGAWYSNELFKFDAARMEKVTAAGNTETEETLAVLALEKGYAERAMDAYARASKAANASTTLSQTYKDSLLAKLKEVYGVRYNDDMSKFDAYLKQAGATSFIDPATPVPPIVEAPPPPVTEAKTDPKAKAAPQPKKTTKQKTSPTQKTAPLPKTVSSPKTTQ